MSNSKFAFGYTTREETRFARVYDKNKEGMRGNIVFSVGWLDGKKLDEIEKAFSSWNFEEMYICDVVVPRGRLLRSYTKTPSKSPAIFFEVMDSSGLIYENEVRLKSANTEASAASIAPPAKLSWRPGGELSFILRLHARNVEDRVAAGLLRRPRLRIPFFNWAMRNENTRFDRALKLVDEITDTASFDTFMSLFNEETDLDNGEWLNLVALAFDNTKHDFHNDHIAHLAFTRAAELGSASAAYNLGTRWLHGYWDKVDAERAKFWYKHAFELGHGCGGSSYSRLLMNDPRYGDPKNFAFKKAVHDIIAQSEELGGPWAVYQRATLFASGRLGKRAPDEAIARYEYLTDDKICEFPKARSALNLAIRYFLGFDVAEKPRLALAQLNKIPSTKEDPNIQYGLINSANKLRYMIKQDVTSADFRSSTRLLQNLYHSQSHEEFERAKQDIRSGKIQPTRVLMDTLWAAMQLAEAEEDALLAQWQSLQRTAQLQCYKIDDAAAVRCTNDFGLLYNKQDSNGVPVLGEINPSKASPSSSLGSSGFGRFNGLKTHDGEIDFSFNAVTRRHPALILSEDIDVVFALAFGDRKGPIWPYLSLEPLDLETPDRPRWVLTRKDWFPSWIGTTQLGKTLYATDYWIGELVFNTKKFSTSTISSDTMRTRAEFLLNAISLCGGRSDGLNSRVMLQTKKVNWNWRKSANGDFSCTLHKVTMAIDGANTIVDAAGVEDRSVNLNDSHYAIGRAANLLSEHYDALAQLWPLYERLRQLNGLLYSVIQLRKFGFQLNKQMQHRADASYRSFVGRPPLKTHELLVL